MIIKKIAFIYFVLSLLAICFASKAAYYRMVCLKRGTSGQDQNIRGIDTKKTTPTKHNVTYHTHYVTQQGERCYFRFDPNDIEYEDPRKVEFLMPDLHKQPSLPSHEKRVYFIRNVDRYQPIINALQQPGKSLTILKSAIGQEATKEPALEDWREVKSRLENLGK